MNASPPKRGQTFAVEVSSSDAAVAEAWAKLEPYGAPFQRRAWVAPWRRLLAPAFAAAPLYVVVRDAQDARPLMFLPLYRRRRWGLATLAFADLGVSDYNAPLLAPDFAPSAEVFQGLWRQIVGALPSADLLRFDKVPATVGGRDNPLAQLDGMRRMGFSAWPLALPATREAYDAEVLDRKTRKEQRRKRKNLGERVGVLKLVHAATPADGEAIFAALRRQRAARFKRVGRPDLLDDPRFLAFYRAVAFEPWSGFVDLAALKTGDRILATLLSLRCDGGRILLMHAFEPELEALSPGIVAIDELITELIASGERLLDFTIGDETYKRQFGVVASPLMHGLLPLSRRGRLYVAAHGWARYCKRAVVALAARIRRRKRR